MAETRILFSTAETSTGIELWITNGGTATRLTDLNVGAGHSQPSILGQVGKWVYFSANNGDGRDLYRLDTTTNHVSMVGPANSNPGFVAGVSGAIYLSMDDGVHGRELWLATAGGVSSTGDTYLDGSLSPSYGGSIGDTALFAGNDATHGTELFVSSGGAPHLLKDINPLGNSNPGSIDGFFKFGSMVLFDADDGGGPTLWSSNGSTASEVSTVELPQNFFAYNNGITTRVLFSGQTPGGFSQYVYVTDGTSGGTSRVTDQVTTPSNFTLYKGKVYFSGYDSAYGRELWVTDGTSGGTELAVDLDYTSSSSSPSNLRVINGKLIFTDNQHRLWWTNGDFDDAHLIRNFVDAQQFVEYGTKVYFVAYTSSGGGYQIWTTDGSTATVTNLVPSGSLPPALQSIIIVGGTNKASNFADELNGTSGNNTIDGKKGNDTISGGDGADTLKGSDGNDALKGGDGKDSLDGGANTDTADFSDKNVKVTVTLSGGAGTAYVGGTAPTNAEDKLKGIENLTGGKASDALTGDTGGNVLKGNSGSDTLKGGDGNDTLYGGLGNDRLDGGANSDQFRFDKTPNSSTNVDHIVTFTTGADKIVLENAIFSVGSSLSSSEFLARSSGHTATNGSQRILYDKSNGELWYDNDGNGAHAAVKFAVLDNKPAGLGVGDFLIV